MSSTITPTFYTGEDDVARAALLRDSAQLTGVYDSTWTGNSVIVDIARLDGRFFVIEERDSAPVRVTEHLSWRSACERANEAALDHLEECRNGDHSHDETVMHRWLRSWTDPAIP